MDTHAHITSIDKARRERHYIALAEASPAWIETVASFHLSGIEVTRRQAIRAGRMIAGDVSLKEVCDEILAEHFRGLTPGR